eukprot:COSAG04_NODE_1237_length_7611_cov_4.313498_5_plen_155_part_00
MKSAFRVVLANKPEAQGVAGGAGSRAPPAALARGRSEAAESEPLCALRAAPERPRAAGRRVGARLPGLYLPRRRSARSAVARALTAVRSSCSQLQLQLGRLAASLDHIQMKARPGVVCRLCKANKRSKPGGPVETHRLGTFRVDLVNRATVMNG